MKAPVRVFQDFASLDLISDGRAEIMAGRGSFTESFPLFGYDLRDYDALFSEKLELLLQGAIGKDSVTAYESTQVKGKGNRAPNRAFWESGTQRVPGRVGHLQDDTATADSQGQSWIA